jgi:hypothetical protein
MPFVLLLAYYCYYVPHLKYYIVVVEARRDETKVTTAEYKFASTILTLFGAMK